MKKRSEKTKIFIGSDHTGFALKQEIKKFLASQGYLAEDIGSYKYNKTDDYPDYALKVCRAVLKAKTESKGILICGTGQGMSIAANKFPGIRAALCWNKETAVHASEHLNSNVLCLGDISLQLAKQLVVAWLETLFLSKEKRHIRRINKIKAIEKRYSK
ncbi:MAG: ribose 5-phosphate isomerase B [Candidatus Pacearchaeota archaeon]|nr:MAG: ribose 5-phosphate isomerase B [Candidatus Pacearchaeota archaeon]